MTRRGKPGKPNPGFPIFPLRLEIAFAIPTFPRSEFDGSLLDNIPRSLALFERSRQPCYSVEILPGTLRPRSLETVVLFSQIMAGFGVTTNGRI